MSRKDGQFSVVGTGHDSDPLSLNPKSRVGTASSASVSTPTIRQQQQVSTAAPTIAQPKKATSTTKKSHSSGLTSPSKPSSRQRVPAADDDDEDEGDLEEIIPKKVPDSDSEDEDEPPARRSAAITNDVQGKTFMSEVDLENMKLDNFPTAKSVESRQADRESAEAALAAAESSMSYRPRAEWSTSGADRQSTDVFCATWSPDSRFLAVGCGDGSIRVFNASTGKVAYLLRSAATTALGADPATGTDDSLPITCIRFRPSGPTEKTKNVLLAASADGSLTHWHMMSQTCLYSIQEQQEAGDSQVYACDYRSDGDAFATGGRDGKVRIYDESTKALTQTLAGGRDSGSNGHSNRIYAVKYHPTDDNLIVSGGWDNTIQIWDVRAGHSVRSFYGPHLCGDALDISPDGSTILTGSWRPNETLQRWELATGKLVDTIPFSAGPGGLGADRPELLYAASFSPDGRTFAAGGCGTNEAKIFTNVASPKVIERVSLGTGGAYCLAFAPSGKKLAIGGGGTHVTIVDL